MTLRRLDILNRVQTLVGSIGLLPTPITIDSADLEDFAPIAGLPVGADLLTHTANLSSGDFTPTRDAGPETEWEGTRDVVLAYGVQGASKAARTARAATLVPMIETLIAADRTLGLGDPQVYAQIGDAHEEDGDPAGEAATAIATAIVTINVLYVAASAAG